MITHVVACAAKAKQITKTMVMEESVAANVAMAKQTEMRTARRLARARI